MEVLGTTRLRIRDQNELLNQIAGTYKDFYRAAMEYIDNSIDAAEMSQRKTKRDDYRLEIHIDTKGKKITFIDNCGGMSPDELCNLLNSVGRSSKKQVPWANGQFGFGVHAFRAFAKHAVFISKKENDQEASITIDRSFDETTDVKCIATKKDVLKKYGTYVEISKYDGQVFKKSEIFKRLVNEIEHHFDDVLRKGSIDILVSEDGSKFYKCRYFDFSSLQGEEINRTIDLEDNEEKHKIKVVLKVLLKTQDNRLPVLTNKNRRIQTISDLKSYKTYLRYKGHSNAVWNNPFVVGYVEIDDITSPNLTRDDLKDTAGRENLFDLLLDVQLELERKVDEVMNKKASDSYHKFSSLISDCLSNVLKNFKLRYERPLPTQALGNDDDNVDPDDSSGLTFGGVGEGGASNKPPEKDTPSGSDVHDNVRRGENGNKGGAGSQTTGQQQGSSQNRLTVSSGPKIIFQSHAGEDRVIDLDHSLIINTQHNDFILRNRGGSTGIKLDARLINYVSLVVAPYCVHRLFEKSGKMPTPIDVGSNLVNLSTRLEDTLISVMLGHEIKAEGRTELT